MIYIKCLSLLLTHVIIEVLATIIITDRGLSPLVKNSVALQLFVDVENKGHSGICKIYSKVKKCCFTDSDEEDCDIIDVYSETFNVIKPKDRNTLVHVLPILYQHDLIGYCEIFLIYLCPMKQEKLKIHIPFDTTIQSLKRSTLIKNYIGADKHTTCETLDQNPLDTCSPTDCDLKYFGKRSFYDVNIKRCIKTPVCLGDADKELPDVVYVPEINMCKDLSVPLSFRDIYLISTGLGTITRAVNASDKSDVVKVKLQSDCKTISQNLLFLKDLMYGKLCPCGYNEEINFKDSCISAVLSILFCIISVCAALLSFVCCVNTTVWVHRQWLDGSIKDFLKNIQSKFKSTKKMPRKHPSRRKVNNSLLREVITNDIPLKLRDSAINLCDSINIELQKKKYQKADIVNQMSLRDRDSSSSASSSDVNDSEKHALIKCLHKN